MEKTSKSAKTICLPLSHEVIPTAHHLALMQYYPNDLKPHTVVCIYSDQKRLKSVIFNLRTRRTICKQAFKSIGTKDSEELSSPRVDSDAFVIKENNRTIMVLRYSETEFHLLSFPRLRVLYKFATHKPTKSKLIMCYINNEIVTWFKDENLLTFWKLFSTKPSSSLKLPFSVGSTYSQLTNRNLLILQNEKSKELAFVDVIKKQILKTIKVERNLYHSINSEDRIFRYSAIFFQGAANGECRCDTVSSDFQLTTLGRKIGLRGPGTRLYFLDGAKLILRQSLWKCEFFELTNDQVIFYPALRPKDERYSGFLQLPKEKRKFVLASRDGKLLFLQLGDGK